MPRPRLVILGASGFVGSTLCERLFRSREFEFTPFAHSYGNTSRLARFPMKIGTADALSPPQLRAALDGADVVIDLTRGLPNVMPAMTRNLVAAARRARVKKIVHLSSIAIYGKFPGPDTASEAAPPRPDDDYGLAKLRQDRLLMKLHNGGIPVILFCPANIYGPYAPFIIRAVQYLREGKILLVDGGHTPSNNVHVENVVEAILAAVRSDGGCGERYFVNDPEPTTWREFYADLGRIIGREEPLPEVPAAEVRRVAMRPTPKPRLLDNFRAILSGEFRRGLSAMPLFRWVNESLYNRFSQCSLEFQERVRARLSRPTVIAKDSEGPDLGNRYVTEQLRSVYHSPKKLATRLGWVPRLDRAGAMESVRQWLRFANLA